MAKYQQVNEKNCDSYSQAAAGFAKTWQMYAYEATPAPHYKIAYNVSESWGLKVGDGRPAS